MKYERNERNHIMRNFVFCTFLLSIPRVVEAKLYDGLVLQPEKQEITQFL